MKRLIAIIITIFSLSPNSFAQGIWKEWEVGKVSNMFSNKSTNIQEATDNGFPRFRNISNTVAQINIDIPLSLRMTPLKPLQFKFAMQVECGVVDVTVCGENYLGMQRINKECEAGLGINIADFIVEYDLQNTLTFKYKYDSRSDTQVVGRILNCTQINSIKLSVKPNTYLLFIPSVNYRTMTFDGIEQETLRLAHSYASSRNDFITAKAVLNHFINDYGRTDSYEAYLMRAMCNVELEEFESAISDATSAINKRPQNCEYAYFVRGVAKLEMNDFSGIADLKLAGQDGRKYMIGHNLSDSDYSPSVNGESLPTPQNILSSIIPTKKSLSLTPKQIYNKYNNSVFMIYNKGVDGTSQGSGFFIGKNGLAISNYHVFEGAIRGKEQVKLMNGGTYQVKEILGYDKENDFIIFRVEGNGFSYIPITKRGYEIGDEVYAIGSPKGMQNTLSNGLISQKWDDTKFQISVPIDHGSSGGALINQYGEVIGITSGGRDDTHANLNYAVDIRTIFNQNE